MTFGATIECTSATRPTGEYSICWPEVRRLLQDGGRPGTAFQPLHRHRAADDAHPDVAVGHLVDVEARTEHLHLTVRKQDAERPAGIVHHLEVRLAAMRRTRRSSGLPTHSSSVWVLRPTTLPSGRTTLRTCPVAVR